MGLIGLIINVHVHMDIVQKALPQFMNNTMTIAIALKRRLEYKNAYQTGKSAYAYSHESTQRTMFSEFI